MRPVDLPLQQSRESLDLGLSETMVRYGGREFNLWRLLTIGNPFKCPSSTLHHTAKESTDWTVKPEPGGDSSLVGLLDLYHPVNKLILVLDILRL